MRCKACDRILEDSELTKKDSQGEFIDLCNICLSSVASAGIDTETMEYYQYEVFTDDDKYDTLY